MSRRLRTAISAIIVGLAVSGVSVAVSPAANASVSCRDQQKQAGLKGGIYSYWGNCSGRPDGTSRDYRFREVIGCPEPSGDPSVFYGPWLFDTTQWSKVACPDYARAVWHHTQLQYV
jgi:hypothetical protein